MPWLVSRSRNASASASNALSSSNDPCTKWTVAASRSHTSSRHGVRAALRADSRASSANSVSPQSRRAKPISAKLVGSRPRLARSYTAGNSFLRARSPVMPNTTSAHGSGTRGSRRSRGSRSGLGIIGRPRSAVSDPSRLVFELTAHRLGELVPRVDELLDALVLEHPEHVVEVDSGVVHGLHDPGGLVVGLLHGRARRAVVGVGLHGLLRHRVDGAGGDQ